MNLQNIKLVDQRTKDIVYGFIKRMEKSLLLKHIPIEIYDICLAFYYFPEFFNKAREDCFKISDDKLTITAIMDCSYHKHTIFMKRWIDSNTNIIAKWRFRINNISLHGCSFFWFSKQLLGDVLLLDFAYAQIPNYSISYDQARYINSDDVDDATEIPPFDTGNVVTFTLDLIKVYFYVK